METRIGRIFPPFLPKAIEGISCGPWPAGMHGAALGAADTSEGIEADGAPQITAAPSSRPAITVRGERARPGNDERDMRQLPRSLVDSILQRAGTLHNEPLSRNVTAGTDKTGARCG